MLGLGYLHLRHGDVAGATSILERGVGLCRVANTIWFRQVASVLASAYAFAGRVGDALSLFEEAMRQTASGMAWRPFSLASLGETCWLAGRVDDALDSARDALTAARDHGERGNEAYVLRLLGEIATHGDPPDRERGEGHYRQALALADELGMGPVVAHCHAGLGRLYRRTGGGPAEEHLATARRLYRDMGMGFWLERMEGNPT